MSPLRYVPVLRAPGGVMVFESAVINEYLAAHASAPMSPDDPLDLAVMRAGCEYGSSCQGAFADMLKATDESDCRA